MKKCLEGIIAIILLFVFFIVVISVMFREVLNVSTSWCVELSQFCLIFLTFIGSAACMEDESHIKITFLIDRLSEGTQKIFRIIGRLLAIFFLVIFVIGSYENMLFNWNFGFITVSWMKIGYMYLVLFISGVIMIYYLFKNIYYDLFSRKPSFSKLVSRKGESL